MGTWNAFEFLHLARAAGLPMPQAAFLSAMAAPDIPTAQRPWRQQRLLSEADFKVGFLAAHLGHLKEQQPQKSSLIDMCSKSNSRSMFRPPDVHVTVALRQGVVSAACRRSAAGGT